MNALEAMDPNPTTLKPDDTISYAAECIMQNRYRNLPVIDNDQCYVGMFGVNCLLKQVIPRAVFLPNGLENVSFLHESFDDLYRRYAEVKDKPISICMNNDIKPVHPDTPLTDILIQLYETKSSIPVIERDTCKLLGMISYWEIGAKILSCGEANK
jgi:CBS domain-containing protein